MPDPDLTIHQIMDYELRASWWASWIGWGWLQNLASFWFAWKVRRKFSRYKLSRNGYRSIKEQPNA
jgi:hypothetical protein